MQRISCFRTATLALLILAAAVGRAQEPQAAPEPGRGVARIGVVNGEVSVRRGEAGEWVAAVANAPISVNDHLATSGAARAEIQFDAAMFLRLGANSELHLAQLEQKRYQVQIARGTVDCSVLRQTNADIELDTPSVSVRPQERGNYRISVSEDGQTEITVRAGHAEIYTPRGVETLNAGKTMQVRGDPSNPEFQIVAALGVDEWDRWNADRDRQLESAGNNVYNRYVSPDEYGAESLEGNGRWVPTPDYGNVWTPNVAPGWAPYRDGRWAWDDYYGWSWVGYDPGAGRLITTAAGSTTRATADGAGGRVQFTRGITGHRRTWASSGSADRALASASDTAMSDGCRWRRSRSSVRGGAADIMAGTPSTAARS